VRRALPAVEPMRFCSSVACRELLSKNLKGLHVV
jgi:hypothetical protein